MSTIVILSTNCHFLYNFNFDYNFQVLQVKNVHSELDWYVVQLYSTSVHSELDWYSQTNDVTLRKCLYLNELLTDFAQILDSKSFDQA